MAQSHLGPALFLFSGNYDVGGSLQKILFYSCFHIICYFFTLVCRKTTQVAILITTPNFEEVEDGDILV